MTFQPTPRNKITAYLDKSFKGQKESITFTLGAANPAGVEWETATTTYKPGNYQIGYLKWSSPISSRLLLEAGGAINLFNLNYNTYLPGIRKERGTPEWYASAIRRDLVLNTFRGAPAISEQYASQPHYSFSSSASYATGSHTFKGGVQVRHMLIKNQSHGGNADLIQQYRNGVPDSVAVGALPFIAAFYGDAVGLYAMDSWTLGRLTMNAGLRFDRFTGGVDESAMAPGRFVPARQVASSSPVPDFNDLSPRLSAVYDLFGNAKTALKFSVNKYLRQYASNYYYPYSPITQATETRNWFDCDLTPGTSTCSGRATADQRRRHRPGQRNRADQQPAFRAGSRSAGRSRPEARIRLGLFRRRAARIAAAHLGHRRLVLQPQLQRPAVKERAPQPLGLRPVYDHQSTRWFADHCLQPRSGEAGNRRHRRRQFGHQPAPLQRV